MKEYTKTNEWFEIKGAKTRVGITEKARRELGEIVYIELPLVGKELKKGEEAAVLESTKAAADLYTPVAGVVSAVHEALAQNPSLMQDLKEDELWLFELTDPLCQTE